MLLGISGGIAAYKIPLLVRILRKNGAEVTIVLTRAARALVAEETLRTLSGNTVFTDDTTLFHDMNHIRLAQGADLFLVAPATANTIAKIAHGIADNLLTSLALSFRGPLIMAPAMNPAMWENAATVENISVIRKRGVRVLPVSTGFLACGEEGEGRMIAIETIAGYVTGANLPRCFTDKKILIASGPTMEPVDPVRVITNRSSGAMGAALAMAALCMDAEVTVVSGPASAPLPEGIIRRDVVTSAQMADALNELFPRADICIMAAAISDFKPKDFSATKLKRQDNDSLRVDLVSTIDVAATLSKNKKGRYLVCFSLESSDDISPAVHKMEKKGCDMMVFNTVESSLAKPSAAITILVPGKQPQRYETVDKRECAGTILLSVAKEMGLYHG
jgi:phosphopantothenoylcysteine decarboxylase/phosphopantothenate--cysteine ligase